MQSTSFTSSQTISVDPHIVPWSCRGSFLCLATRSGKNGRLTHNNDICLVSHVHPNGLPLFALRPHIHGPLPSPSGFHTTPSPVDFVASPSRLAWVRDGPTTVAEATFYGPRVIRIRGNLPLSFDTDQDLAVDEFRTWIFTVPGASQPNHPSLPTVEFTSRPDAALRFVALKGRFNLINDAPSICNNRRITISPTEDEREWDLLIVERERAPFYGQADTIPSIEQLVGDARKMTFDQTETRMASEIDVYTRSMCPWTPAGSEVSDTDRYACYVMWTSTVRPGGFFKSESVLMSKLWMNKVWSWDNCFNCLALAVSSPDVAIRQMLVPFDYITPEGRLPDSICHSELLYDYTKPPIYGWVVFKLLDILHEYPSVSAHRATNPFDRVPKDILRQVYDGISSFTLFWYRHRSSAGSGVPWYSHGNDSGWDNSTAYDDQTMCSSPDLAAFLIVQNDLLAQLAGYLGLGEAKEWNDKRVDMVKVLINELWDKDHKVFLFKDAYSGRRWTSPTLLRYIPLVASNHLPKDVTEALAAGVQSHLTEWGLATEDPNSPLYESDGYWRGPIWAPPTIIIESGLRRAGYVDLANEISDRYAHLCDKTGFAENYDAKTGEGNRDLSYTWSASTYLVLRSEAMIRRGKAN